MKKIILFFTILFPLFCGFTADAQGWVWGRGSDGPGLNEGYFCSTDAAGNVYAVGYQWGTNNFGTYFLPGPAAYVVKYDSVGHLKWAVATATTTAISTSNAFSMITDQFGHEYLLGIHSEMLTFGSYSIYDPGPIGAYYFLAKIDSTGYVEWLKNIGDLHGSGIINPGGNCLATDELGNIYVTCPYTGNATIDGHVLDSAGYGDLFVGKFDPSGTAIWVQDYKEPGGGVITSGITVTPSHKLYVTGYFDGNSINFGTHVLVDTGNHANYTGYLAKLDSNGNPLWAKGTGGSDGNDQFTGVATNANEDAYLTGLYASCVLHLGSDSLPQPWYGDYGFLAKYDSAGGMDWLKLMRGRYCAAWAPAVDSSGNVWVSGTLGENICTDTIDGHLLSGGVSGGDPMFVAGWSPSGLYLESATLASGGDDMNGIALDRFGNIFVEGDFETDPFYVGPDTLHLNSMEINFVAKFRSHLGDPVVAITGDSILCKGDTLTLNEATPGGMWTSSNAGIAKVGSGTGFVTGLDPGVTVISYTTPTGFATTTVTVILTPSPIVGPASLCLGSISLSDATPGGTWGSSNTGVATIGSLTGIVTGVSTGAVVITYTVSEGSAILGGCYVIAIDSVLPCEAAVPVAPADNDKIKLFPNPATNMFTITSTRQITSVVISNPLGQVVYSLQVASGNLQTSVDVSMLPGGIYFVKINGPSTGPGQAVVRKFVKE